MKTVDGVAIPEHANFGTPNFALAVPADATALTLVRGILCLTAGTLIAKNAAGVAQSIPCTAGMKLDISPIALMTASTGTYLLLLA